MFDLVARNIAEHWIVATFLGTMAFNENAIVAAFSLSVGSGAGKYLGIALAAGMGTLTNDLILYAVARFGLVRFLNKQNEDAKKEAKTLFERVFLKNIFLSILLLKFLFGMRVFLTLYLVAKKKIPFSVYFYYDLSAVILYVAALSLLGWFIGVGVGSALGVYNIIVKAVLIVLAIVVFLHLISYLLRKLGKAEVRNETLSK